MERGNGGRDIKIEEGIQTCPIQKQNQRFMGGAVYSLLKKQGKAIRNISEYKAICAYTRTLSRMKQNNTTTKMPIIEYTVNDPRLLRNAQII